MDFSHDTRQFEKKRIVIILTIIAFSLSVLKTFAVTFPDDRIDLALSEVYLPHAALIFDCCLIIVWRINAAQFSSTLKNQFREIPLNQFQTIANTVDSR